MLSSQALGHLDVPHPEPHESGSGNRLRSARALSVLVGLGFKSPASASTPSPHCPAPIANYRDLLRLAERPPGPDLPMLTQPAQAGHLLLRSPPPSALHGATVPVARQDSTARLPQDGS